MLSTDCVDKMIFKYEPYRGDMNDYASLHDYLARVLFRIVEFDACQQ